MLIQKINIVLSLIITRKAFQSNSIETFLATIKPILKYGIINHLTPVDGCWG